MAISVTNIGTATGSSGGSLAVTVPAGGVPAGALIVVVVSEGASTVGGSVADTAGNTYTAVTGVFNNAASASGYGRMYYALNATALAQNNTITFTRQTSGSNAAMSAMYATGIQTASALDTAVTNTATGSSTTPSVTSGTLLSAGAFSSGDRSVLNGDQLNISYSLSV